MVAVLLNAHLGGETHKNRYLLEHRPDDIRSDLPLNIHKASPDNHAWLTYWSQSLIHYSCKQDINNNKSVC